MTFSRAIIFAFAAVLVCSQSVLGAGAGEHICMGVPGVIVLPAFEQKDLQDLLANHLTEYKNGLYYPDTFFLVEQQQKDPKSKKARRAHCISESSHWQAFMNAYIGRLWENRDKSKTGVDALTSTAERRSQLAHFLGVLGHNIADNPWHFAPDGVVRLAAKRCKKGNYDKGHKWADETFDRGFVLTDGVLPEKAYGPYAMLQQVYASYRISSSIPAGDGPTAAEVKAAVEGAFNYLTAAVDEAVDVVRSKAKRKAREQTRKELEKKLGKAAADVVMKNTYKDPPPMARHKAKKLARDAAFSAAAADCPWGGAHAKDVMGRIGGMIMKNHVVLWNALKAGAKPRIIDPPDKGNIAIASYPLFVVVGD